MTILKKLKKLGDRGLVIAEAGRNGEPEYYFVLEETWATRPVVEGREHFQALLDAGVIVAQVPESQGAFVDFEKLQVLKYEESSEEDQEEEKEDRGRWKRVNVEADPNGIVIHHDGQLYSVSPEHWANSPLIEGSEGDAGTLVDRGAIAANIPNDSIPIGTYCVLVNLALLNKKR
jgi:hypothetical protein